MRLNKPVGAHAGRLHSGSAVAYLVVLACAAGMVACLWVNAGLASVFLLAVSILALAAADLRGLLVLSYPAYALVGAAVALTFLESGAYITEQRRYGFNIGATPLLCLYSVAFLAVAHGALSFLSRGAKQKDLRLRSRDLLKPIMILTFVTTVFYAITFAIFGTGLGYATRFDWVNSLPPEFRRVHGLCRSLALPVTFALAGVHWRIFGWKRSYSRMWILAFPFVALAATGEKFSLFVYLALCVLTGQGIGGYLLGRKSKVRLRYLGISGVTAGVLLALLVSGYRRSGTTNLATTIRDRIALQGHVWFGIFDRFNGTPSVPVSQIVRPNSLDSPSGLDLLSYFVADRGFVYARAQKGISFTMGGPPSALAVFGSYWGLAAYALSALLYVAAVWAAVVYLRENRTFLASGALAFYVIVGTATIMGYWDALYGPAACAVYLFALVASVRVRRPRATQNYDYRRAISVGATRPSRPRRGPLVSSSRSTRA